MKLEQMWRDLRRRWVWVVAGAALFAVCGALIASGAQPSYVSAARLYIAAEIDTDDPEKLYAQYQISSARVQSQIELIRSDLMRQAVADLLAEGGSEAVSPQEVVVTRPLDTVVIDIQVATDSAESAQQVAKAYAEVAPRIIQEVEGDGAPISVSVIDEPDLGESLKRGALSNALIGACLGAVLAAAAIVLIGGVRRRAHETPPGD